VHLRKIASLWQRIRGEREVVVAADYDLSLDVEGGGVRELAIARAMCHCHQGVMMSIDSL